MRLSKQKWLKTPAMRRSGLFSRSTADGFTLIEILVVVIIIGITLSLAVANLYPDEREKLQQETDRAQAMLEIARDEAAFSGRTVAFNIADNQLMFYTRDARSAEIKWLPLQNASLQARPFAEGVRAVLQLGSTPAGAVGVGGADKDALAAFQSAGVGVPFAIQLVSSAGQRSITVDALGNLSQANDSTVSSLSNAANAR